MHPSQAARIQRAKTENIAVLSIDNGLFTVRGTSGSRYTVTRGNGRLTCSCPDARRRQFACKHCCLVAMRTLSPGDQLWFFQNLRLPTGPPAPALTSRNTECCCCLNDLPEDAAAVTVCLRCRQGFHAACLGNWTAHAQSCPMCRAPIA